MTICPLLLQLSLLQRAQHKNAIICCVHVNDLIFKILLFSFILFYYIDTSGGVFSISSLVRISMLSLISSLSLKLYLNSLVCDQNIFGSSSKVVGNLRTFLENVQQRSCDLQTNFGESL